MTDKTAPRMPGLYERPQMALRPVCTARLSERGGRGVKQLKRLPSRFHDWIKREGVSACDRQHQPGGKRGCAKPAPKDQFIPLGNKLNWPYPG